MELLHVDQPRVKYQLNDKRWVRIIIMTFAIIAIYSARVVEEVSFVVTNSKTGLHDY